MSGGEVALKIPRATWYRLSERQRDQLLAVVEDQGPAAAVAWCRRRGIRVEAPSRR